MIFFMCCCVFAWSFSLILPLPADCAHEHGHIEGALLLTSLNISYFIMRNKPRTLSLHHGRFHSECRMEPYFWLWTVFSCLEQSDEQKMNTNYFLDISKSFKSARMMKTLRLLLMQTMFWFNISNDVFNIKMWNSYLSFVCAWWFFCVPRFHGIVCVRRINSNDVTKIIIIMRTAVINVVWPRRFVYFGCQRTHKTEYTQYKNHKNHKTNNKTHP